MSRSTLHLLALTCVLAGALAVAIPVLNQAPTAAALRPSNSAVHPGTTVPATGRPSASPSEKPATPTPDDSASAAPSEPTSPADDPGVSVDAVPDQQQGAVDCRRHTCIALTFDDGPGPYTQQLLAELRAAHVKATFFMLGNQVSRYPGTARAVAAAGHQVGNHTWDHRQLSLLSPAAQQDEVARANAAFARAGLARPTLLRPPYGSFNRATRHLGVPLILWNVDTEDWKNLSTAVTTRRALAGARPGAIVLMHDIHPSTVRAVPGMIAQLRAQGYVFVTIGQMCGASAAGTAVYHC